MELAKEVGNKQKMVWVMVYRFFLRKGKDLLHQFLDTHYHSYSKLEDT